MTRFEWPRVPALILALLCLGQAQAFAANCAIAINYVPLETAQLHTLLDSTTTCYPTAAPWTNQEFINGTTLSDYKLGKNQKDPTAVIGSVAFGTILGLAGVTYTYSVGGTYSYLIYGNTAQLGTSGATWDFCPGGIGPALTVKVVSGHGGCG